jgi:hypothetical protein
LVCNEFCKKLFGAKFRPAKFAKHFNFAEKSEISKEAGGLTSRQTSKK